MGVGKSRPKKGQKQGVCVNKDPSLPILSTPIDIPDISVNAPKESPTQSPLTLQTKVSKKKLRPISTAIPPPQNPTKEATEHLNKELQRLLSDVASKEGFSVEPVEDNIFKWNIFLFDFDQGLQIKTDLDMYTNLTGRTSVMLEVVFPFHYPTAPPFLRVVYPRFHQYTGHITIGGSVCIKDLTNAGWNPQNELLPFIVMIRNLLIEGSALIDLDNLTEYTETEATEAFNRVAKAHGWLN